MSSIVDYVLEESGIERQSVPAFPADDMCDAARGTLEDFATEFDDYMAEGDFQNSVTVLLQIRVLMDSILASFGVDGESIIQSCNAARMKDTLSSYTIREALIAQGWVPPADDE